MAGDVVSKPTARKTTFFSGFSLPAEGFRGGVNDSNPSPFRFLSLKTGGGPWNPHHVSKGRKQHIIPAA